MYARVPEGGKKSVFLRILILQCRTQRSSLDLNKCSVYLVRLVFYYSLDYCAAEFSNLFCSGGMIRFL